MYNKKLSIRTQQEQVAELTSFGDKSIFQINTSNNITSNSLIFEVQENNAKIKLYNDINDVSEILSFNNTDITISSNVTINNNLNVSNLNVYGTTTTINTSTYETENLEIINTQLDAPSLKIQQSYESTNPNDILDVGLLNSLGIYEQKMVLDTNGNLNISGNIDFNGNLTNSGNTLIYNENTLKTFLSGKKVTTLNLSQNAEIKINDEVKLFHWSHSINNSDVTNSIYYSDTNLLSDISGIEYGTSQSYKSHVNITADIGEGKYSDNLGFLIQNRQRNNAIGFGYNTISQVGNNTNGYLNIKSKGNLPVCIGNETSNILHIFSDKIGIGTSLPAEKLTVYDGRIKIHQNSSSDNAVLHLLSNTYNTYLFTDKTDGSFYIKSHNNNDVIIDSNGNLGINTIPQTKLHVRTTNNTYLRVETDTDAILQTSGIEFGIPSYSSAIRPKITSTTHSNYANDIRFYTNSPSSTTAQPRMLINSNGNIGINNLIPSYNLDIDGTVRLGTVDLIGSHGKLIFNKRSTNTLREAILGYTDNYEFAIADGTNTNTGQLKIAYSAPENILYCNSNVGIGTNNPDKKLHVMGDIKFTGDLYKNNSLFTSYTDSNASNYLNNLDTHIIPITDQTIDIGSVDKKIRDIYVSNNSIWMGDSHKLMVSNEKLKFKKRNKNVIPTRLRSLITDADISSRFNGKSKSDLLLHEWLEFAKEKDSTIDNINEVFEDNDTNYEEQTNVDFWLSAGNNIYLHGDYQNIGIGVTNPLAKLSVHSSTQGDGILISENNALLGKNLSNDKTQLMFWNGSQVYYGRVSSAEGSSLGVTAHNFKTGTSGTTSMRIIDNKVGIGIDSPKAILNVHNLLTTNDSNIRTANTGNTEFNTESLWLGKGDTNSDNYWGLSLGTIWTGSSYIQALNTNHNTYYDLILQPNGGNIGINNKQPSEKLDIDGNVIISSNLTVNNINILNTLNKTAFIINQTIHQPILEINNNNSNVFLINYQGGVGINNTNPLYELDVNGSINFTGDLKQNGELFTSFNDQDAIDLLNTGFDGGLKVTSGNVGIGTSNPLYELDVNGSINFTGDLKQNGEIFTSFNDQDAIDLLNTGFDGGLKVISGNVGIGTTNPNYKLDVNGNIKFTTNINNVSSQSLDYIKNLDEDIINKITQTSNLLDNISSNYTNNIYNLLNYKLDNIDTNTNIINTTENNVYVDNSTLKEINYIGTYKDNTKYIDVLDYDYVNITVLDNIITNNEEITNNLYTGDIIKLVNNNGNIKYEFVKTYYNNKLIIFNDDKINTGTVDISTIKYIKQNYKLLFITSQKTDLDSKFIDNINYTKININSNKIYNFNININFDLTIGADNCRLYIKLQRYGVESQYVRLFTLLPISKNNITTTLNASFSLFLKTGDIITFETNYKVNSGNIDVNTNKIIYDENNILFIGTYEKTVSYIKNIEYNEQNIIINNNVAHYINQEKNNKLSNGDLINIYNDNLQYIENIKRVYETSENSFTIYDNNNNSRGTIIESNNKYIKYNYRLKFDNKSLVDINYSELNIINNNYTKINIKSNKIYLFNITCVFDLLYGTDYCKLYIKLKRLNEDPIYIRKFVSPSITSQSLNNTSTINNSFVLNLMDGDEITFESNYEIFAGFLDIQTKEYNNIIDNIFFIGLYQNNINYIKHLDNNNNDINILNNIAYYNNIENSNKLSTGDIINLYTQNEDNVEIKTINITTEQYFTIYNEDYTDSVEINSIITKYSKYNYRLLFNNLSSYEINNSKYNVLNNSYTLVNISADSIYSFSIGCSFDLIYGTDYCKLYIRLDRKNEELKYIRIFDIYPIKSLKNGYTGTLSASFKLKLQYGDKISFETNYKVLNGFLDINTLDLLDYDKINNTTPWITSESIQNLPWYANNTSFIGTYTNTFNFIENCNLTYKSIANSDNNKFYIDYLDDSNSNNRLYRGDILKLKYYDNTYYRRINEINYTNNYFTLYNTINQEIVYIDNYTEFIKANYLIMFDYINDTDNNSSNVINDNNYTEVKIPNNRIYNFNINLNFNLTYATDYCRFYVKLKNTTTTKYIRTFYLEPISMFDNISSSLNASFKLKLNKNDIITFESNHKLNEGYLDIDL